MKLISESEFVCGLGPLLLLAKAHRDEDLWTRVSRKKCRKRLLPGDMEDLLERQDTLDGPVPSSVDKELLEGMLPNTLSHLVLCLSGKLKGLFYSTQLQEAQLKYIIYTLIHHLLQSIPAADTGDGAQLITSVVLCEEVEPTYLPYFKIALLRRTSIPSSTLVCAVLKTHSAHKKFWP